MTVEEPDFAETLEAAKLASAGQLLIRAARLFNDRAIARARADRGLELRAAHMALIPHVSLEGTRTTELADRLAISKQAVGQMVSELEDTGMLRRVPDPSDGRAKLVRFTAAGRRALLEGIGVLRDVETDLADEIGEAAMSRLRRDLGRLVDALEREAG